ncbi:hypothetical protein Tco_0778261 [Tanacetum coccineum]
MIIWTTAYLSNLELNNEGKVDQNAETNVMTYFAKPSILGKPVGQPLKNQSVVRQPTAFKSERPRISKPRFASQVDVNNDLSKPVTTHHLPKGRESAPAKPHHMILKLILGGNQRVEFSRLFVLDGFQQERHSPLAQQRLKVNPQMVQMQISLTNVKANKLLMSVQFRSAQRQEMSVKMSLQASFLKGQKASDYDNSDPVPPRQNVVPTAKKTDSSQQGLEFLFSPLLERILQSTQIKLRTTP